VEPIHGALVAAVIAAIIIGLVSLWAKQREDTVISALWAVGMAVGIVFIARTPGYSEDLMGYLFGNILMVSSDDLWMLAGLDIIIVAVGLLFYNQFMAVCFDQEFARLRGIKVELFYLLLLGLAALTVVVLSTVVGIVMVIALLTLPVGIAALFSTAMWRMMVLSTILCAIFTTSGLVLSYGPDYPAGATTIIIAGAAYLGASIVKWILSRGRA
jgi:zinc transport system permease protein